MQCSLPEEENSFPCAITWLDTKPEEFVTCFLPYTSVGGTATIALFEPGAFSTLMASNQAELGNLCFNLSAAPAWLYPI